MLTFDVVRLALNITIATICVLINLVNFIQNYRSHSKLRKKRLLHELGGASMELLVLANFSLQVVYLFKATRTEEIYAQKN